jgi:hypothetical protein
MFTIPKDQWHETIKAGSELVKKLNNNKRLNYFIYRIRTGKLSNEIEDIEPNEKDDYCIVIELLFALPNDMFLPTHFKNVRVITKIVDLSQSKKEKERKGQEPWNI